MLTLIVEASCRMLPVPRSFSMSANRKMRRLSLIMIIISIGHTDYAAAMPLII